MDVCGMGFEGDGDGFEGLVVGAGGGGGGGGGIEPILLQSSQLPSKLLH